MGALWFTEWNGSKIGRITIVGAITEYLLAPGSQPLWMAAGPDGALWFTEQAGNAIGRITTAGAVTGYPVPTANSSPWNIRTGPDGALWFTEYNANKIARITTGGAIVEYALPSSLTTPSGIASGSGVSGLWIAGLNGNSIGAAPACGLGLTASFADNVLNTSFDLGIDSAAIWSIVAQSRSLLERSIAPVVPPHAFSINWQPFPNGGDVTVKSTLSASTGAVLCAQWTTVNTAP
jgi:hypothetical protein